MDRRALKEVQWLKDYIGVERIFSLSANRLDDHPLLVNQYGKGIIDLSYLPRYIRPLR